MRNAGLSVLCLVIGWQLWSCLQERAGAGNRGPVPVGPSETGEPAQPGGHDEPAQPSARDEPAQPSARDEPEEVRIGTWNLRRLGHGDKRLDWAARVIDREFDVLAVQEVMSKEGVADLLKRLPDWTAVVSKEAVGTERYREWYAVLYRRQYSRVIRSFTVTDRGDAFMREPFVVCMAVRAFDFCLVDVHIIFGKKARQRDAEIFALGDELIGLRGRADERDWLVLGDFNRMPRAPGWDKLRSAGWDFTLDGRVPTSLGKKGYASPYDHILVDRRMTGELVGSARRVDIIADPCAGDVETCRTQLSDHAPIVARFRADGPDDD